MVDLHAITVKQEPKILKDAIQETVATFLASGIDPKKVLSLINQGLKHTAKQADFSCIAKIGWLSRMTQFKEKAGKDKEKAEQVYILIQF